MKKLLFLVLFGALLFTACGERTSDEYQEDFAKAMCDLMFDCYPAEAAQIYGSESQCVTQESGDDWDCDDINYSNADTCLECYEKTYTCNDLANDIDPCGSSPECLHSCND